MCFERLDLCHAAQGAKKKLLAAARKDLFLVQALLTVHLDEGTERLRAAQVAFLLNRQDNLGHLRILVRRRSTLQMLPTPREV